MTTLGTWLVMIGSAFALIQAVGAILSIGLRRTRLRKERATSEAREARLASLIDEIRRRWGDNAADMSNFREMPEYQPSDELDAKLDLRDKLMAQRDGDDWVHTWNYFGRQNTHKHRELRESEQDWRRIWTLGVPGLVGAVMSLVGGVLLALAMNRPGFDAAAV